MSQILDEVLDANRKYADSFTKGDLAMPPARRFAIHQPASAPAGDPFYCPRA